MDISIQTTATENNAAEKKIYGRLLVWLFAVVILAGYAICSYRENFAQYTGVQPYTTAVTWREENAEGEWEEKEYKLAGDEPEAFLAAP